MKVVINGGAREVLDGTDVAELVDEIGGSAKGRGIAVAVNGEVVPRSEWSRSLKDDDRIEILTATQGG